MKKLVKMNLLIAALVLSSSSFATVKGNAKYQSANQGTVIDSTLSPVYTVISTVRSAIATAISPFLTTTQVVSGGNSAAGSDAKVINQLKRNAGKPVAPSNGVETDELGQEASSSSGI